MIRAEANGAGAALLHVRYDGRSFDVPLRDLEVAADANDRAFKNALARYLDINAREFDGYVLERHETGNLTIRPEAVFG